MDVLQLVFAFVNAPLFATFSLGMFWRRTTSAGAFCGLIGGTAGAALHHGLTLPAHAAAGIKGAWLGAVLHHYPSEMAQNFWTAIWAWLACFVVTILVSLATRRTKTDDELRGLVYGLTERPAEAETPWYRRAGPLGAAVLAATILLNLCFW